MDQLQILNWDTGFFGFPVAKITDSRAAVEVLQSAVAQMRHQQIRLAYWAAEIDSPEIHQLIASLGGRLVDEKLTFIATLQSLPDRELPALRRVEPYQAGMSMTELKDLSVQSGQYSRFVVDPQFPAAKARELYEEWIIRSVDKTVAEEVLVIRQDDHIAGMATLVRSGEAGSIGLIAVAERFRGQKMGEALVRASQIWWKERGCQQIRVVTQEANEPAKRLYQKCGFEVQKREYFYHIWLD